LGQEKWTLVKLCNYQLERSSISDVEPLEYPLSHPIL